MYISYLEKSMVNDTFIHISSLFCVHTHILYIWKGSGESGECVQIWCMYGYGYDVVY